MLCASCLELITVVTRLQFLSLLFSQAFTSMLTNTLPGPSASEVTTLLRYTNRFIIIIIIIIIITSEGI